MTAKIKLNAASGGGSVSLKAPSTTTSNAAVELQLPVADGSANEVLKTDGSGNLAFAAASVGITEVDQYRMSSSVTSSGNNSTITGWERFSTSIHAAAASPLGTGMSVSSGIFTFPSTGKYLVILNMKCGIGTNDNVQIYHKVTVNNSTYTTYIGSTDGQNDSGTRNGSSTSMSFIDVTNTTNVKLLFHADSVGSGSTIFGGSNEATTAIFIRLGDT